MARPTKTGIDYFTVDVQLEDKVKLIEAKYKLEGFGLWIKLLKKIYQHNYYIKWNEERALLFSNEVNVDINLLNDFIKDCLQWGIFNKKLYNKYNILTSRGIQKRYFEATKRRNEVEVDKDFLLVNKVNEHDNFVFVNNNSKKENDNEQSKVKESKGKESKENSTYPALSKLPRKSDNHRKYPDKFEKLWELYPKRQGAEDKGSGYAKFRARVNEGIEIDTLTKAVKNYEQEQKNEGNINTRYIMQMKKFFGAKDIWLEYAEKEIKNTSEPADFKIEKNYDDILDL